MTLEQALATAGFVWMAITSAILVGLWRGRQEAADKAASAAIANTETVFGLRLTNLETKVDSQGKTIDMRIRIVDGDINGLKESIGDVKQRLGEAEAERREEFQRLHKIGNETHAMLVQHLTRLQDAYVPRTEYEARGDDVERRITRLESNK